MDARGFLNTLYVSEAVRQHWEFCAEQAAGTALARVYADAATAAAEGLELWRLRYARGIGGEIADELCQPLRSAKAQEDTKALFTGNEAVLEAFGKAVNTHSAWVNDGRAVAAPAPTREAAGLLVGWHMNLVSRHWPERPTLQVMWNEVYAHVRADIHAVRLGLPTQRVLLGSEPIASWQSAAPVLSSSTRAAAAYRGLEDGVFKRRNRDSLWLRSDDGPASESAAEQKALRAAHVLNLSAGLTSHSRSLEQNPKALANLNLLASEVRGSGAADIRELVVPEAA